MSNQIAFVTFVTPFLRSYYTPIRDFLSTPFLQFVEIFFICEQLSPKIRRAMTDGAPPRFDNVKNG